MLDDNDDGSAAVAAGAPIEPTRRRVFLFEYIDRPWLDITDLLPPAPPPRPQTFYRCPAGCGATSKTPKRCRPCGVKMRRVCEVVPPATNRGSP